MSDLERGRRRTAGLDVAKKIARALGVSIDWLAGAVDEDEETSKPVPRARQGQRPSQLE